MADRRSLWGIGASLAAVVALAVPAEAGFPTHFVDVDDPPGAPAFAFTPDRIDSVVSHRVDWQRGVDGDARHGIRQEAGLFGIAPTSGPIQLRLFVSAGTFRYYCPIHGSPGRGMDGVIRVAPKFDADPELDPAFTVVWASEEDRATGGRFDVRFRRQGGSTWTIWKNDTLQDRAEFGVNDKPLHVVEGRAYEFQARSEKLNNPDKRSGWSPVLVATATDPP